jgi:hypothetical protein
VKRDLLFTVFLLELMDNRFSPVRTVLFFSFFAVLLGYIVASPFDWMALSVYGLVFLAFATPFLLRWHHALLIASWNMNAMVFLLPGTPLWLAMVILSLLISVGAYALIDRKKYSYVPQLIYPLIFIAVIVLATGALKGGLGLHHYGGGSSGGKRTAFILGAILGYFAITARTIPPHRAALLASIFFLGGATAVIGNLLPLVSPSLYLIFAIFPPEHSGFEAMGWVEGEGILRLGGLAHAGSAVFCAMLAIYGIRGILDLSRPLSIFPFRFRGGFGVNKPWRLLIFCSVLLISLLGGFRSMIVVIVLTFAIQFYYEKLFRSPLFPVLLVVCTLTLAIILPMANKLPLSMQRTLSVFPINVDPVARNSAQTSTEWRIKMWKRLLPEIPQYFFIGKGYGINSRDLEILSSEESRGQVDSMELSLMAGDYHNGLLTIIIPLGIFGVVGFGWFVIASVKVLSQNYRFGDPSLVHINRFFLVYFIARVLFFLIFYGSFYTDLFFFTGLVGLNVSLNGGVKNKSSLQNKLAYAEEAIA